MTPASSSRRGGSGKRPVNPRSRGAQLAAAKAAKAAGNGPAGKNGKNAKKKPNGKPAAKGQPRSAKQNRAAEPAPEMPAAATEPRTLRLAVVPGATPGKWISIWRRRFPDVELELVHVSAADAQRALLAGEADVAILRYPVDKTDLHVISLYDELPVVIVEKESALTAADELTFADLAGEVVITPGDDVLRMAPIEGTLQPQFPTIETTEDVIATVASGIGITIVPMSLARLHQRKDVTYRTLTDGPTASVGIAWPIDPESADVEAFIGIVRGRTANSSRD